jgi:hypothetical protein
MSYVALVDPEHQLSVTRTQPRRQTAVTGGAGNAQKLAATINRNFAMA